MRSLFIIVLATGLLSCARAPIERSKTVGVAKAKDPTLLAKFKRGTEYLDKQQYRRAAKAFNDILVDNPTSELDLIVLYNSGAAYEGLNDCDTATKRYRQIIRKSQGRFRRLEAQAKYRLSYAYLCQAKHEKVLVTLLELQKDKKYLPFEIREAELPARLAIAYALTKNRKTAADFYRRAESGLVKIQSQNKSAIIKKRSLAKTLFHMGNMNQIDKDELKPIHFLNTIKDLQIYLLKSIEMDTKPWSNQSHQQIVKAYNMSWDLIREVSRRPEKTVLEKRKKRALQSDIAAHILGNIEYLRSQRFPEKREPKLVSKLFSDVQGAEARIKSFMAANNLTSELTPGEKRRRGLRREGRTLKPNPRLERAAKKRLPEKKGKTIQVEDPNL